MACPASAKACEDLPDVSSDYAEAGTLAHDIASAILKGSDQVGHGMNLGDLSDDIVDATIDYTERVMEAAAGKHLLVEQQVDYSEVIGEPGSFGTADAIIIGDGILEIHDLKTGRNKAYALPQLGLYALGAVHQFEALGPFHTVRLVIDQGVIGHFDDVSLTAAELEAFANEVRQAVVACMEPNPAFIPGDKQCRFCRAKAHCPALAAHVEETIGQSFENLDAEELKTEPDRVGLNYLSHCMAAVDLVEIWCKGVRARTERELLAGNAIDGWKLVQGRKGARKWSSEDEAEAQLRKMKLKVEEIYSLKVISPTTAEKLAKAGTVGPRQWAQLQRMITQAEGGLSVAPSSDSRPAASPVASVSDFEALS
jgi:hypothetical protein